jgi:hypothetical protein
MGITSRRLIGRGLFVVSIAIMLSGCKAEKAEEGQSPKSPGLTSADSPQQLKLSARDFVLLLQHALKSHSRDVITRLTRFPVQIDELGTMLDEESFARDYDKIWDPHTVKAVLDEDPNHFVFASGALSASIGCGEVWLEKTKDLQFKITAFHISEYRIAGMSIEDCYRGRDFVVQLQRAVSRDRRGEVAGMLKYPLYFHKIPGTITLRGTQDTLDNYDLVFSPRLRRILASQRTEDLLVNQEGLAVGLGKIWIREESEGGPFKVTAIFEPLVSEEPVPAAANQPVN